MPAPKLEKTEYLKARVDERIKSDFEDVCRQLGIKPAEQMRELVVDFLEKQKKLLSETIQIQITRPDGYDYGAWHVQIKVKDSVKNLPAPFQLPKISHRSIHSEPGYQAAWLDLDKHEYEMGGLLINRLWRGNLYSNGMPENENPSTLDDVREALKREIEKILASQPFNI
ncbi:hypothetical protein [Pseudomonas mohnii]|jgi:hypothetical protein